MQLELFTWFDWLTYIVVAINVLATVFVSWENKIVCLLWAILLSIPLYARYHL